MKFRIDKRNIKRGRTTLYIDTTYYNLPTGLVKKLLTLEGVELEICLCTFSQRIVGDGCDFCNIKEGMNT